MSIKTLQNGQHFTFPERLREAFQGARDAEIARKLGYKSQSPIAKWFDGESYPSVEVLLNIARITKVNLHWLLTGEGETTTDRFAFFGSALLMPLLELTELRQTPMEELVRLLVRESLLTRCCELVKRIDSIEPDELVELHTLLALFTMDPNLAAPAVANLRRA